MRLTSLKLRRFGVGSSHSSSTNFLTPLFSFSLINSHDSLSFVGDSKRRSRFTHTRARGINFSSHSHDRNIIIHKTSSTFCRYSPLMKPSLLGNEQHIYSHVDGKSIFATTFSTNSSSSNPSKEGDDSIKPTENRSENTLSPPKQSPSIIPGVALSIITATTGFQIASILGSALSVPISGIPTSILLGILVNNSILQKPTTLQQQPQDSVSDSSDSSSLILSKYRDPALYKPGLTFSTKTILQTGIVAVAAKLSFFELAKTGAQGLPVVAASMGMGMLYIPMAGRMAGLTKELTYLLTAGTSICGVTAITALAPAINATNRDIAIAVANTVAFGTVGMLTYPYLFHNLCISPEQAGVCLGVSIHDTSQVLGSAMSYKEVYGEEMALKVAAVTKLTRNLGLIGAIPGLTYLHAKEMNSAKNGIEGLSQKDGSSKINDTMSGLVSFQKYVPSFLVAFLGMSTLRTVGDYSFAVEAAASPSSSYLAFQQTMDFLGNDFSKYALGTAMAGVGLSTSTDSLKGVGWLPFAVGGTGALAVGGTGYLVSSMIM